ncbi:MAG: hypothetical protein RI964_653 [Pseudomonadota bacterium]|jgi:hypothetical protein
MKIAWLACVLCAASLLAACGGDNPSDAPKDMPKSGVISTTEAPAAPVTQAASTEPLPAALAGHWLLDDKSLDLKIQGHDWLETSEGTAMPAQTVEYQSTCESGEKAQPCLLVKGEFDATFYAVLKLDAQSMTLQMIDSEMPPQTFARVP